METSQLFAVIIAGGRGTRFWPLSRKSRPKHLLTFHGSSPLLRETIDRILPLVPAEGIYIVTSSSHAGKVREVSPDLPSQNVLVEPTGKNTAPAIALAAAHILDQANDPIMVVLPADHMITPTEKFLSDVQIAASIAAKSGATATFGVRPTRPETGYGYIEVGKKTGKNTFSAVSFKEKPNRKKAKDYIGCGRYLWNSGMFVFRTRTLMENIRQHLPALYTAWETYRSEAKSEKGLERYYSSVESISIDYGVLERIPGEIEVVNASFEWNDIGSWEAIDEIWEPDSSGNRRNECEFVSIAAKDNTVVSKKLVALLGVDNLIVVETDDALLICKKDRSQDIKSLVEEIEKRELDNYL